MIRAAYRRARWIWCCACFHAYIRIPMCFGIRAQMWLLLYAGEYAHSATYADFTRMCDHRRLRLPKGPRPSLPTLE
jgi:hypothetical protein